MRQTRLSESEDSDDASILGFAVVISSLVLHDALTHYSAECVRCEPWFFLLLVCNNMVFLILKAS
jgi:hypothetical protein